MANEKDWKIDDTPKPPPDPPSPANRKAFVDPLTGVLKAVGLCATNEPGDQVIDVPEDFNLKPGTVKRQGHAWVPYTPPKSGYALDREACLAAADAVIADGKHSAELRAFVAALKKVL